MVFAAGDRLCCKRGPVFRGKTHAMRDMKRGRRELEVVNVSRQCVNGLAVIINPPWRRTEHKIKRQPMAIKINTLTYRCFTSRKQKPPTLLDAA